MCVYIYICIYLLIINKGKYNLHHFLKLKFTKQNFFSFALNKNERK